MSEKERVEFVVKFVALLKEVEKYLGDYQGDLDTEGIKATMRKLIDINQEELDTLEKEGD